MRRLENLQSETTKYIIRSREYDNLTDKHLLDLLSEILGFPDIEKVEEYVHMGQRETGYAAMVTMKGFSQWYSMYNSTKVGLLEGIHALRALLDLTPEYVIDRARNQTDIITLVAQLKLYPQYISRANVFYLNIPLSMLTEIIRDLDYQLSLEDFETVICRVNDDIEDIMWLFDHTNFVITDFDRACTVLSVTADIGLTPLYVPLLTVLLESNSGLRDYIETLLRTTLFTIETEGYDTFDIGDWRLCLPYSFLKVLDKFNFTIYPSPTSVTIADDILAAYVGTDEEELRQRLMSIYGVKVSEKAVVQAVCKCNYELAKRWLREYNLDVNSIISELVDMDLLKGVKWVVETMDIDGELLVDLYSIAKSTDMIELLYKLGAPIETQIVSVLERLVHTSAEFGYKIDDLERVIDISGLNESDLGFLYNSVRHIQTLIMLYNLGIPLTKEIIYNVITTKRYWREVINWLLDVVGMSKDELADILSTNLHENRQKIDYIHDR